MALSDRDYMKDRYRARRSRPARASTGVRIWFALWRAVRSLLGRSSSGSGKR